MKQQGGEDLCSLFSGLYFVSLRSKVLFCEDPDHSTPYTDPPPNSHVVLEAVRGAATPPL